MEKQKSVLDFFRKKSTSSATASAEDDDTQTRGQVSSEIEPSGAMASTSDEATALPPNKPPYPDIAPCDTKDELIKTQFVTECDHSWAYKYPFPSRLYTSPRNVLLRDLSCYSCYNCRDESNSCTSEAGTFRQYKLVHEMEVIERLIPNSDENRFIENIKPGIILAVFTDDPGVDYYVLKCISEVKQFKQAILDDLGNNSQAKV
ncbi:unnamed protein product [Mytilus coruscus]|uniref:Uncharacterized protein n=1 Tax=Mytilus coruscus TaxID=42192 RepID=A0A6J8EBE9_MYTCO|nr:unnamed protein product [Mytilus coruscus]